MIKNPKPQEDLFKELEKLKLENQSLKDQYEQDIAKPKQTEEALQRSELRFRTLYENAKIGLYRTKPDGTIIMANKALVKMLGYPSFEKIAERNLEKDSYEPQYQRKEFLEKIERDGVINDFESLWVRQDGSMFFVRESAQAIRDSKGTTLYYDGEVEDITEQRQTELERQIVFEIIRGITTTNNLSELLKLIHQSLAKRLYADNCFIALYDEKTKLFSFPYWVDKLDPVPEPVAMKKSCSAYVFRTGKTFLYTRELYEQLEKQNEVVLVGSDSPSWIGVPLKIPDRTMGVLVLQHYEEENVYSEHDVEFLDSVGSNIALAIERKMAEKEIQELNEQLLMSNLDKDKFFSVIAHDLRSPFHGFIALTQLMSEDISKFSADELSGITHEMNQSAKNLFKLLQNLLEWAQFQKGSLSFTPQVLSLSSFVSKCVEQINPTAIQKGITIINEVSGNQKIFADETMIYSILGNLLSNAVKFTVKNGTVTVRAVNIEDQMIKISVRDTGIGMSESIVEKLFKISKQKGRKGTEGELSTGLGLLLCKEFVEKNGGKIWVESEEGVGSTFYFTLPEKDVSSHIIKEIACA